MSQAQFVNLQGAADALVNGGIIVPEFQKEIVDLVRRSSILAQRMVSVPATGSPSRFFEQTAIGAATFTAPGGSAGGTISPTPSSPTRIEKSVTIKGITNQLVYSLFDVETIAQQNVFAQLKTKDMMDLVNGVLNLHAQALWTGTDTVSGNQVGNGGQQYVGLLNQISTSVTIASGVSIVDTIRTQIAKLMSSTQYNLTGLKYSVYITPLGLDYLEQEAKNNSTALRYIQTAAGEVGAGITVNHLMTAAGPVALIPEPYLPMDAANFAAAPTGQHNYPFAIVCEPLCEYHYIGSKDPRVFQLGTLANLNEQYVAIQFGAPVVKAASYAHVIGTIQR